MPEQNTFDLNMSQEERLKKLATMGDKEIDYSDIPELTEAELARFLPVKPGEKAVLVALPDAVINWLVAKSEGNYQDLIVKALESYIASAG